jgi:hypothetical protein
MEVGRARFDLGQAAKRVLRGLREQGVPFGDRFLADRGETTPSRLQKLIDEFTFEWCLGIFEDSFGPFTHNDLRAAERKEPDDTPATRERFTSAARASRKIVT